MRLVSGTGEFVINGINWYGFETTTYVAHGLWSRDIPFIRPTAHARIEDSAATVTINDDDDICTIG